MQENVKIKVGPKKLLKTKGTKNDKKAYPKMLMKTNGLAKN